MKVYLSADIEGTCGIVDWSETILENEQSIKYKDQMSKEVYAACEGAKDSGATEILVKDAHDSARNINPNVLPKYVQLFRGWSNDPLVMVSGLNESFDACIFTGYHSAASTDGNPLAHTMDPAFNYIKINGKIASEFTINAYACAYYNVPVAFLSGDEKLCKSAKELCPNIVAVPVSQGYGNGSISLHPQKAIEKIKIGVREALQGNISRHMLDLPETFSIEINYKEHHSAFKASFYPNMKQINANTVLFETNDYYEVLRMLLFL